MQLRLLCFLLGIACVPVTAQETLTLDTAETDTIATTWRVRAVNVDADAPNIEVTLKSDTGRSFVWRFVVCEPTPNVPCSAETGTATQVRNAIGFINRGDFRPLGKTLNQWILEQIIIRKIKAGMVTP